MHCRTFLVRYDTQHIRRTGAAIRGLDVEHVTHTDALGTENTVERGCDVMKEAKYFVSLCVLL